MKQFLTERLRIKESRLIGSLEKFYDAMSKGSKNRGIDAIFDEIPYMKFFLNRYKPCYEIVGPTYRTDGTGFAILNVTQGPNMNILELENFGPGYYILRKIHYPP
ncbi:hypothetical protein ACP275_10G141000 [Erythranthe tilingii]